MPRRLLLIASALLLTAATVPVTPPPRYDAYDVDEGGIVTAVGKPFTIRLWDHGDAGSEWRLAANPGVVPVETARFEQAPDPEGGVGFSDGQDVTIKVKSPGKHRLLFQFFKDGKPMRIYGDKAIDVTAR